MKKKFRPKIFIQINIGDEDQKGGVSQDKILKFYSDIKKDYDLDIIGLMCIPPVNIDSEVYFEEMKKLNKAQGFAELSMGMSSDFLLAAKNFSTYLRIGSSIFGQRF